MNYYKLTIIRFSDNCDTLLWLLGHEEYIRIGFQPRKIRIRLPCNLYFTIRRYIRFQLAAGVTWIPNLQRSIASNAEKLIKAARSSTLLSFLLLLSCSPSLSSLDHSTMEKRLSTLLKYVRPQSNKISLSYLCHYPLDSEGSNLHSYRGLR